MIPLGVDWWQSGRDDSLSDHPQASCSWGHTSGNVIGGSMSSQVPPGEKEFILQTFAKFLTKFSARV